MPNPTVRIISLITFAAMLHGMRAEPLAACSGALLLAVLLLCATDFRLLLRRARWLLLSIVLIYAYATPGEYVASVPDAWAPTYEGLREGSVQILRLAAMLAALSVLLATSSRAQIMAGIYQLTLPFKMFGIQPERFAARLWLTLHYVEHMPPGTLKILREHHWDIDALQTHHAAPDRMTLELQAWRGLDTGVLLMLPLLWWCTR